MQVVGGGQRSLLGRVITLVVVLGLLAWFIKSPVEAAHGVRDGWNWLMNAVDAVETFFRTVFG
jgi:hypothetical protein